MTPDPNQHPAHEDPKPSANEEPVDASVPPQAEESPAKAPENPYPTSEQSPQPPDEGGGQLADDGIGQPAEIPAVDDQPAEIPAVDDQPAVPSSDEAAGSASPPIATPPAPLPTRPADGHKGTFGTVMIVGGCPTMPGAPAIAARAAFRTGAGLVKIVSDHQTLACSLVIEPHATGVAVEPNELAWMQMVSGRHAWVIGPGWGTRSHHPEKLAAIWEMLSPAVWDADALNLLANHASRLGLLSDQPDEASRPEAPIRILTPHPGEFNRLADAFGLPTLTDEPGQRLEATRQLALRTRSLVILKGSRTLITDGVQTAGWSKPNAAMATAGSGDVLSGILGALLAAGLDAWSTARWGVRVHSLAGKRWTKKHGNAGLRAAELADQLLAVLQKLRKRS